MSKCPKNDLNETASYKPGSTFKEIVVDQETGGMFKITNLVLKAEPV